MKVTLLLVSLGFLFCTNSSSTSNAVAVEAVKTRNYDVFIMKQKRFAKQIISMKTTIFYWILVFIRVKTGFLFMILLPK
jgi:hypothetical protein